MTTVRSAVAPPGVVNVSSVRQRSPLRYPGGKTWLVPYVLSLLRSDTYESDVMYEPFAGGGIISLSAVAEGLVDRAVMVEKDDGVAAMWSVILGDHRWLVGRILSFEPTRPNVEDVLASGGSGARALAFRTIIRNRFSYGGIMARGASLIKGGESGRGITSRWYPETIAARITEIARMSGRLRVVHGDGLDVMARCRSRRAIFFIDPPYTAAGKRAGRRLYDHSSVDHARLFRLASRTLNPVVMTYDRSDEVAGMARSHGLYVRRVPMVSGHHAAMDELVITNRAAAPRLRSRPRSRRR